MSLDVKPIDPREFACLQEEWNRLLSRSICDNVFLRWEWIHTWWDIFKYKGHRTLFILTARRNGCLVGIAPFFIDREGPLKTRYLKLCSDEVSPDYLDIMAEKGHEAEVVHELWNYTLAGTRSWDVIDLDNLRAESPLLADPSLHREYRHSTDTSHQCPYIKIQGTFEDYYRTREGLVRFSLEKKLRKLTEQMGVTYAAVQEEKDLATGFDHLFRLHAQRAKEKNITSDFLSPDTQRFHREVSRLFLREQILNLQFLCDGKTPITALYNFTYGNKAYYYQAGTDPAWGKWSVGALLHYLAIRHAFEQGLDEYDFLKGNENYKSLWSNAVREEKRLAVYNRTLRGLLHLGKLRLKTFLKRRWRNLPISARDVRPPYPLEPLTGTAPTSPAYRSDPVL
jgi:CelD/BcsL family acetyltransferase involved in cellulose biosynthesis